MGQKINAEAGVWISILQKEIKLNNSSPSLRLRHYPLISEYLEKQATMSGKEGSKDERFHSHKLDENVE